MLCQRGKWSTDPTARYEKLPGGAGGGMQVERGNESIVPTGHSLADALTFIDVNVPLSAVHLTTAQSVFGTSVAQPWSL